MKRALMGTVGMAAVAILGAPQAHAEVIALAPHERSITTADGWQISVRLEGEEWNKVPPTNRTGTSREGFGTLRAVVNVDGQGSPLNSAQVQVGYVVGCFVQLNSVNAGASLNVGPSLSIEPGFPIPIVPRGSLSATVQPTISASMSPGEIKTLPISAKAIASSTTVLQVREAHMNIDSCLGPAEVRAFVAFTIDSAAVKDSVAVYGDPYLI